MSFRKLGYPMVPLFFNLGILVIRTLRSRAPSFLKLPSWPSPSPNKTLPAGPTESLRLSEDEPSEQCRGLCN